MFRAGNMARQTAETAARYQGINGFPVREAPAMLMFPIVSAVFAALIVAAILLWKAGASQPR